MQLTDWDSAWDICKWAHHGLPKEANAIMTVLRMCPEVSMAVNTLEGRVFAVVTDWIVKGVEGEFYLCKDSIFQATYEEVKDESTDISGNDSKA